MSDPSKKIIGLRAIIGFLLPPVDLVISTINDLVRAYKDRNVRADENEKKAGPTGLRYYSRSGTLIGLALGLVVAICIPVPGATALYIATVTAPLYLPILTRFVSSLIGGRDSYLKTSRLLKNSLSSSDDEEPPEVKAAMRCCVTATIFTALFGDYAGNKLAQKVSPITGAERRNSQCDIKPAIAQDYSEESSNIYNRKSRNA